MEWEPWLLISPVFAGKRPNAVIYVFLEKIVLGGAWLGAGTCSPCFVPIGNAGEITAVCPSNPFYRKLYRFCTS